VPLVVLMIDGQFPPHAALFEYNSSRIEESGTKPAFAPLEPKKSAIAATSCALDLNCKALPSLLLIIASLPNLPPAPGTFKQYDLIESARLT